MKKYTIIFICMFVIFNIYGCTYSCTMGSIDDEDILNAQSTEVVGQAVRNVDWNECIQKTKSEIESCNDFVDLCSIKVDEEKQEIQFAVIVNNNTTLSQAQEISNKVVRTFNDYAYEQNNSIKKSGEYYLGSIYDIYVALIAVSTEENLQNTEEWYVYDNIKPGLQVNPTLQKKYRLLLDEY